MTGAVNLLKKHGWRRISAAEFLSLNFSSWMFPQRNVFILEKKTNSLCTVFDS